VRRETIISFNTIPKKKQTRDKHKKTHNAKQLLLKKMGLRHDLGLLCRAIA
jgi:hypothetical protein